MTHDGRRSPAINTNTMKTATININMDKKCPKCNEAGLLDNGRCLKCTTDELLGRGPSREFKKIKLDIATRFLELTYTERVTVDDRLIETEFEGVKRKVEVHADLAAAVDNFIPHMVMLTELFDSVEFEGRELMPFDCSAAPNLLKFQVSSVSMGGSDEHFGLSISGRKNLRNGRVFNISAPFTKFEGGEHEEQYGYASAMFAAFTMLEREVNLFLDEGKAAPSKQTKLEFDDAAV